jgi:Class II flagellar assembly regulator
MRINAAVQPSVSNTAPARRTAGSGFSVSNDNTAGKSVAAQAAGGINGIDALLALQGVEDAIERRRRFAKRGAKALDMLDALKVQIIEGRLDLATLTRLEGMLNELAERSGEDRLDGVLDAIGLRVAVEIAKRRPRLAASRHAGLQIETADLG